MKDKQIQPDDLSQVTRGSLGNGSGTLCPPPLRSADSMEGATLYLQYSMEPKGSWATETSQPVDEF